MQKHNLFRVEIPVRFIHNTHIPEPGYCTFKPDCEGCPYPAHGFQCYNVRTGACIRSRADAIMKNEPDNEDN